MLLHFEIERARLQMTRAKLARALFISPQTYTAFVRGERAIPSDVLIRMAELCSCSVDYLLELTEDRKPPAWDGSAFGPEKPPETAVDAPDGGTGSSIPTPPEG